MTYELAKELKEAGWPQTTMDGDSYYDTTGKLWRKTHFDKRADDEMLDCPTLSELIAACGGKNFRLQADKDGKWFAYSFIEAQGGDGSTPEEAVAGLWLALHPMNETDQGEN